MADIFDMADTWNDGATTFTAIKMNVTDTASDAASLLMDLQIGGISQFFVEKNGTANVKVLTCWDGDLIVNRVNSSSPVARLGPASAAFSNSIGLSSTFAVSTPDVSLHRDAANQFGVRNGTNAQTFNIYNTYTDASNYERLAIKWNTNVIELKPEAAGTGTVRDLHISGLPTSNPGPGILWNNAGTPAIGT